MNRIAIPSIILLGLLFLALGCHHATEPPPPPVDTTSHAISWQKALLGEAASSGLLDVAIANDTAAYAVGVIFLKDSLGNTDPLPYNFIRWNGREWHVERQATRSMLYAVYAFSPADFWVAYGWPQHWNGMTWETYQIPGAPLAYARRFWGRSSSDLYMVGDSGLVAYFDGTSWTKIPTTTTLPIKDIYGSFNKATGQWEVLAVAGDQYHSYDRVIFRIDGLTATELSSRPMAYAMTTTWFSAGERYYIGGSGIYYKSALSDSLWLGGGSDPAPNYTEMIRGTALNDIFAVGDFGDVWHYSKSSWKSYHSETAIGTGAYFAVAIKGNLIIAVGEDAPKAAILVGRRGG